MLFPIGVFGQGPLLWELQDDIHGGYDLARAVTLSGRLAVVVGNGAEPQEGTDQFDFVIQGLARATGAIRWSDQTFLSLGTIEPLFLTTRQNTAYAVGTLRELGELRSALLVRAYDVPSGTLLWENVWHPSPGVDADHPTGIVVSPTHVVVVGSGENATRTGLAMLVRAYDPRTGAVLWEDREGTDGFDVIPWTVAAKGDRVVVAGTTSPFVDTLSRDLFVRAYDALSGDVAWEISRPNVGPTKLAIASRRVLVAGASSGTTSGTTYLAAFSAKSGAPLWQDAMPIQGHFANIAVNGPQIVAAVNFGTGFAVRAFDLQTGSLEWEARPTIPAGFQEHVSDVDLNDHAVFVAGSSRQAFGNSEFMVRAFDARDGTLLWDDRSHSSVGTEAVDLALGKFRLFVAGYTFDSSTSSDWLIRAYDVRSDIATVH